MGSIALSALFLFPDGNQRRRAGPFRLLAFVVSLIEIGFALLVGSLPVAQIHWRNLARFWTMLMLAASRSWDPRIPCIRKTKYIYPQLKKKVLYFTITLPLAEGQALRGRAAKLVRFRLVFT